MSQIPPAVCLCDSDWLSLAVAKKIQVGQLQSICLQGPDVQRGGQVICLGCLDHVPLTVQLKLNYWINTVLL